MLKTQLSWVLQEGLIFVSTELFSHCEGLAASSTRSGLVLSTDIHERLLLQEIESHTGHLR